MIRSLIFVGLLLLSCLTRAQTVWPGDINNNGVVNHIDLLLLGEVFGEIGPPRDNISDDFSPQEVTIPWGIELSNGLDLAFADCNGDGEINEADLEAIENNYKLTHGIVVDDEFEIGLSGEAPPLFFPLDAVTTFIEASIGFLPIVLGTESIPVTDFYGIAFTIKYDADLINADIPFADLPFEFAVDMDMGFFMDDEPLVIVNTDTDNGTIEVAASRRDGFTTPPANDLLGFMFIVIEDNAVGLGSNQEESLLEITDIKLVDETGDVTPVVSDSINITIYNDDILNSTNEAIAEKIKTFPNPVDNELTIKSELLINSFELVAVTGQVAFARQRISQSKITIPTSKLSNGLYSLNIYTDQGILSQKIVIQH